MVNQQQHQKEDTEDDASVESNSTSGSNSSQNFKFERPHSNLRRRRPRPRPRPRPASETSDTYVAMPDTDNTDTPPKKKSAITTLLLQVVRILVRVIFGTCYFLYYDGAVLAFFSVLIFICSLIVATAAFPLLLLTFTVIRLLQFFYHGEAYDKAVQFKLFIRACILLDMVYFLILLWATYSIPTQISRVKHVMFLGLRLADWVSIYAMICGIYLLSCVISVVSIHWIPLLPLDHNESGLNLPESAHEIVECLMFLFAETEIMNRVSVLKHHKILGLYTRQWIKVTTIVLITYNVITYSTHMIVWLLRNSIDRRSFHPGNDKKSRRYLVIEKFLRRRYIVYWANGIKRSINMILGSLLLLLTWVCYFGSHLEKTPQVKKILKLGTRTFLSLLIWSFLWLIKTCVLLSWEERSVYKRLDSRIVQGAEKLYFYGLISRYKYDILDIMEDKKEQPSRNKDDPYKDYRFMKAIAKLSNTIFPKWVLNQRNARKFSKDRDKGVKLNWEKGEVVKVVSMERLKKLKHELFMHKDRIPTLYCLQQAAAYFLTAKDLLSKENYTSNVVRNMRQRNRRPPYHNRRRMIIKDPVGLLIRAGKIVDGKTKKSTEDSPKQKLSQDPSKQESLQDPPKQKISQDPLEQNSTQNLFQQKSLEDPSKQNISQDPSEQKSLQDPFQQKSPEDPLKQHISQDPSEQKSQQDPFPQKSQEDPPKQNISQDPFKQKSSQGTLQQKSPKDPPKQKDDWDYFLDQLKRDVGSARRMLPDQFPQPTRSSGSSPRITLHQIKPWMENARNNSLFLANTLSSAKEVAECLNRLISWVLVLATFIMWLLLTGLATTKILVLIASPLLAGTFVFGDTLKTLFQGIMFAFVVHTFDVGDLCLIDGIMMEVKTIGVWKTTFLKIGTQEEEVISPNSVLSTKTIINYKTNFDWSDTIELEVTCPEGVDTKILKRDVEKYIDDRKKDFKSNSKCVEVLIAGENIKLVVNLRHKELQNSTYSECLNEKRKRRSELIHHAQSLFNRMKKKVSKSSDPDTRIDESERPHDVSSPSHSIPPMEKADKQEKLTTPSPGSSLQSSSTQKVYAKDREKLATDLVGRFKNQAMMMERSKQSFSFKFPASVFHSEQDHHVTIDPTDMLDLCNQNQIGSNHISIFMKYLSELCHEQGISKSYGFCDSNILAPQTPTITTTKEGDPRSDYLARAFLCDADNHKKLFLAPYIEHDHWRLAIISPWNGLVYWLDSAGEHGVIPNFAKETINEGINKFNMQHCKDIEKNSRIVWKQVKCPRQPTNSNDCGYYVCRYMLETVKDKQSIVPDSYYPSAPSTYSQEQIDEIKYLWITYVTEWTRLD